MTETQTPYGNNPVNNFESSEVFPCPHCGKSLIEYTGHLLGFWITCPGCDRVIVGGEANGHQKKK